MLPMLAAALKHRAPRLRPRPPHRYRPEPMPRLRWYS
jgi:hypothetical protein